MTTLSWSAIVFSMLLFLAFPGRTYVEIKSRAQRLEQLRAEVEVLRERRAELEEELAYRQSAYYIEKEAREQLNYAKPDEVIVILPDLEDGEANVQETAASAEVVRFGEREIPSWRRNADRWRKLFFGD